MSGKLERYVRFLEANQHSKTMAKKAVESLSQLHSDGTLEKMVKRTLKGMGEDRHVDIALMNDLVNMIMLKTGIHKPVFIIEHDESREIAAELGLKTRDVRMTTGIKRNATAASDSDALLDEFQRHYEVADYYRIGRMLGYPDSAAARPPHGKENSRARKESFRDFAKKGKRLSEAHFFAEYLLHAPIERDAALIEARKKALLRVVSDMTGHNITQAYHDINRRTLIDELRHNGHSDRDIMKLVGKPRRYETKIEL